MHTAGESPLTAAVRAGLSTLEVTPLGGLDNSMFSQLEIDTAQLDAVANSLRARSGELSNTVKTLEHDAARLRTERIGEADFRFRRGVAVWGWEEHAGSCFAGDGT